jgi:hypothetical protein
MNKKKLAVTFFLGTWGIGRLAEGCYMSGAAKGLSTIFLWWTPIPFVWWGADVYKIATSSNFCHSKKPTPPTKKPTPPTKKPKKATKTPAAVVPSPALPPPAASSAAAPAAGGKKSRRRNNHSKGTRKRRR